MPSLKQAVAEKKAQEPTLRRTRKSMPSWIGLSGRIRTCEYYEKLSKEELIRNLMLGKMQRSEYTNGRNAEIKAWIEEHPEIKERIEQRIRNVPPQNRERAFINAAKSEAMNQTVRTETASGRNGAWFRGGGPPCPPPFSICVPHHFPARVTAHRKEITQLIDY